MHEMNLQNRQKGASAIVVIIILVILGYAVYVGLQYAPLSIESGTVDSILDNIEQKHYAVPIEDVNEIQRAIDRQLLVNQMKDLKSSFHISKYRGSYTIKVSYERDLNLGYKIKKIKYEKARTLE